MQRALRTAFPDRALPAPSEGFATLSDPSRLADALRSAGFAEVHIEEIEAVWEGPAGDAYMQELGELHSYMGAYRMLGSEDRRKVEEAVRSIVEEVASAGRVSFRSPVLLAFGIQAAGVASLSSDRSRLTHPTGLRS